MGKKLAAAKRELWRNSRRSLDYTGFKIWSISGVFRQERVKVIAS